jgi:hypothetical protein
MAEASEEDLGSKWAVVSMIVVVHIATNPTLICLVLKCHLNYLIFNIIFYPLGLGLLPEAAINSRIQAHLHETILHLQINR